jgi:hypothetical protein
MLRNLWLLRCCYAALSWCPSVAAKARSGGRRGNSVSELAPNLLEAVGMDQRTIERSCGYCHHEGD